MIDPVTVSVIGAVNVQGDLQSPSGSEPSTKKPKKDKPTTSKTKTVKPESKSATDSKIAELNQKWSDRFNRSLCSGNPALLYTDLGRTVSPA